MSYSHIPPQSNFNGCERAQAPILCTRCPNVFHSDKPFSMTCPACCKRDVNYTIRLGNQARIFQINVALLNFAVELSILGISDDRELVLKKLIAQLEQEKLELSKNI